MDRVVARGREVQKQNAGAEGLRFIQSAYQTKSI
ncbi:MAG: hypothetical protein CG443_446, partial [Methanosaeta sp. ASP1-1]